MRGWHFQSYRHSLAARGISTRLSMVYSKKFMAYMQEHNPERYEELKKKIEEKNKRVAEKVKLYHQAQKELREKMGPEAYDKYVEELREKKLRRALAEEYPGIILVNPQVAVEREHEGKEDEKEEEDDEPIDFSSSLAGKRLPYFNMRSADDDDDEPIEGVNYAAKKQDKLLNGLYDKAVASGHEPKIDGKQLQMGIKVEMEHTDKRWLAEKIARDHLTEIPNYYTKLTAMEKGKCFAAKFSRNNEFVNNSDKFINYPDLIKWTGISLFGVADDVALIDKKLPKNGVN